MNKTFVIFDLEYTTWEGAMDRHWSGENEYREIVQIAAIKVDRETWKEIDSLDVLVAPKFNPALSNFFTQLTGITNEELQERGQSFDEAMTMFKEFSYQQKTFSYGNDTIVLGENIGYYKASHIYLEDVYLKSWAEVFHQADPATTKINSGRLAQHFGVDDNIRGQEHNALYDCRSQLEAFKHLYQKGHKLSF